MKKRRLSEWQGKILVLAALACWAGVFFPYVFTSNGAAQLEQRMTIFMIATGIVGGVLLVVGFVLTIRNRKELGNPFRRDYWK